MKPSPIRSAPLSAARLAGWLAAAALLAAGGPAWAQYKVVKPDGSVTYTDRPPADSNARVIQLGRGEDAAAKDTAAGAPALPYALQQVARRYPVTLYTAADCTPCNQARQMLLQRGVPFSERLVATRDDAQALERLVGGSSVPALSIGAQPVRGYSAEEWNAFLDAAGYPRRSELPAGWAPGAAQPLVERSAVATGRSAPTAAPVAPPPPPEVPASGGVRF
ncbi:MAG: glutaredoxin family protein [Burkholderiales bacterium]|nr:glutaredoxin family protein [Burkholderiales bacterium]